MPAGCAGIQRLPWATKLVRRAGQFCRFRGSTHGSAPRFRKSSRRIGSGTMTRLFTDKQGQYLSFIYYYTKGEHQRKPTWNDILA